MKFTKENSVTVKHKRTGKLHVIAKSSLNALHVINNFDLNVEETPVKKPKPKPKPKAKPKAKKKTAKKKK